MTTDWPHAPLHRLGETGVFMVTSGTYQKRPLFDTQSKLKMLHSALLSLASKHGWQLEAWAVFPNHYHFIAQSPPDSSTLVAFLRELHSRTAIAVNRHDHQEGRKVWHNFWESRLEQERAYLARLHYVHHNPVKHGIVAIAGLYPFASAGWFERTASPAQIRTIYGFPIERLRVPDDF